MQERGGLLLPVECRELTPQFRRSAGVTKSSFCSHCNKDQTRKKIKIKQGFIIDAKSRRKFWWWYLHDLKISPHRFISFKEEIRKHLDWAIKIIITTEGQMDIGWLQMWYLQNMTLLLECSSPECITWVERWGNVTRPQK